MIDAGQNKPKYEATVRYLKAFGISRIDHFFISHPDRAYYGGLASIIVSGINVKKVYYHLPVPDTRISLQARPHYLKYLDFAKENGSDTIQIDQNFQLDLPNNSSIKVVHVEPDVSVNNGLSLRDMSMIIRFDTVDSSVLFTGNLGRYLGELLTGREDIKAEFLKMPYPGPGESIPTSFYKTVAPKYLLAPAPKRQWCGDDGRLAREWSIKSQLPTWVTGTNGNIHVIWRRDQTVISPQYNDERCKLREFSNMVIKK